MNLNEPGKRLRTAAVVTAGALLIGAAAPSTADEVASRKCRGTIAKQARNVNKTVTKFVDGCHKAQDKLSAATAACNVVAPGVAPFDPKIKYAVTIGKAAAGIAKVCLGGDPVLANYPSGDPDADLFPLVEDQVTGNTLLVAGGKDLNLDKENLKCKGTILKTRAKIVDEIIKETSKCQAALDKSALTFGAVDPSCVTAANAVADLKSKLKGTAAVQKDCVDAGVVAGDVGACTPLPACVVDNAALAANTTASSIYNLNGGVCGNGVVESPEQCDDANAVDGDGCSASCEVEGQTCTNFPPNTVGGARMAQLVVSIPGAAKLAGLQVQFDYPQFQAGIAGTGQSSIVLSQVTVQQDPSIPGDYLFSINDTDADATLAIASAEEFIDDGNIFAINMDGCVAKELNLCNRNQNVIGCCNASTDEDGDLLFQECTDFNAPVSCGSSFPAGTVDEGGPEDCCPGDNACITQADATACTVTAAADINGQPVAGVTCSVVITGF